MNAARAIVVAGFLFAPAGCGSTTTTPEQGSAGQSASGSVTWAGKTISYQAQGKKSVNVAAKSRTDKATIEATVDGTEYKVEITKDGVEAGGAKVPLENFSKVEIRVDGDGLRVTVDGRKVLPKK
jgi:hypothetical protein